MIGPARKSVPHSALPLSFLCLAGLVMLLGLLGLGARALEPPATQSDDPRILVGPDLLASRDGELPHIEPTVAAHPLDPDRLLGAAMTFPRADQGVVCRIYTSDDGGSSWRTVELEDQARNGLGDPIATFTPRGTALFGCLTKVSAAGTGRSRAAIHVYRSEDGGSTWSPPVSISDQSYDHPVMAVDTTFGHHAGNVYIGVLYGWEATLGVFRSEDDGRSFIGPVEIARSAEHGLNTTGLKVLSDGTLVVTYIESPSPRGDGAGSAESTLWAVTSKDGGVTFSEPHEIGPRRTLARGAGEVRRLGTIPMLAGGAVSNRSGAFHDRLYLVWNDYQVASSPATEDEDAGVWRLVVARSTDGGVTWEPPVPVDPEAAADVHQLLPAPAVNREGTLGVTYFEARSSSEAGSQDAASFDPAALDLTPRFSASVDGGESFLPSRRLTSRPSRPGEAAGSQRAVLVPISDGTDNRFLSFLFALGRWPFGGDYIGLTADASGDFHPLWPDARDGAFQLFTSRISVERGESEAGSSPGPSIGRSRSPVPFESRRINGRVELVSDATAWDPDSRQLTVPLRLRNTSDEPIRPPLEVEVFSLGFGESLDDLPPDAQAFWRDRIPVILNADNGEPGRGALFDYSEALGDFEELEPGAMTGARIWRIRGRSDAMPPIQLEIRGRVPGEPATEPGSTEDAPAEAAPAEGAPAEPSPVEADVGEGNPAPRRMAVTVDDLPLGYAADPSFETQREVLSRLTALLAERGIPAVGFVNEEKLYRESGEEAGEGNGGEPAARRVALLQRWLDAGLALGNHTYSHPDLHRIPLAAFQEDVLRGERVLRRLVPGANGEPATLFFRHPFLHTGRSLEVRRALEGFLAAHHYRVAPVTVDNSEWIFALAYDRALTAGDRDLAQRVAQAYVPYMVDKVAFFERNSRDLFGREIPQVLLIHANRLNADHFGALAARLAERGYSFIPLAEALEDPAYDSPDTYTGAGGLTWLHRWALTRDMPGGFYRGEPRTPPFVLEAAGVESE